MNDAEEKNTPAYKKYSSLVERTLQSFDQVNEWADIIRFLTNLGKVSHIIRLLLSILLKYMQILSSNSQFGNIPLKILVAKRLAQCLNPALPSGVHSKALEVYEIVFKNIGVRHLLLKFCLMCLTKLG